LPNNGYTRGRSRNGARSGKHTSTAQSGSARVSSSRYSSGEENDSGHGSGGGGGGKKVLLVLLGISLMCVAAFGVYVFRDDIGKMLSGAQPKISVKSTSTAKAAASATAEPTAAPEPTDTDSAEPTATPEPPTATPLPPVEEITISAVGDIMAHGPQLTAAYDKTTRQYDFSPNYAQITEQLSAADLTFGNLETTLSGAEKKYSGYPAFNTPDSLLDALKGAGFDLLTTANNHSLDRGWYGVQRTLETLATAGMPATGTYLDKESSQTPLILDVKNTKVAVLAYSYGENLSGNVPKDKLTFCIKNISLPVVKRDIKKAREMGAQIVIVSVHWGTEKARAPSAKMQSQAKSMLEYGADLVIGSHPHVLQKVTRMEVTREDGSTYNGLVAYSLGNFISNQYWQYQDSGIILNVTLQRDTATNAITIKDASYVPTWVYIDPKKNYTVLPVGKYLDNQNLLNSVTATAKKRLKAVWSETTTLIGEDAATPVR
jgi:poly-gamma-glutamate capsule biosynthesis protein CapA/YwtB (metallophosphatase superfamily)